MEEYLLFTFIALFAFGIQTFLYKVSAARKCNTAKTTLAFMITVSLLGFAFWIFTKQELGKINFLIIFAIINAIFFLATTVTRINALKYIPTSISYPIIRVSTIFVVAFSLFYFKDNLSYYQLVGIILAVLVVFILYKNDKEDKVKNFKIGLALTFIAMITSALTTTAQKFASLYVNKLSYITLSYIINIFLVLILNKQIAGKVKNNSKKSVKEAWLIGLFIGIFNFIGFFYVLKAYAIGPLSIVAPLHDMNFVIAIILAAIIYKEKLTKRRILGIVLSAISVILLSIS
jgi:drug/metabolite transporter (DMT)-like permease